MKISLDFLFQLRGVVSLVVPLFDINSVEKQDEHSLGKAVVVTLKGGDNFLFASLQDRDFVVKKLAELLSRMGSLKIAPM